MTTTIAGHGAGLSQTIAVSAIPPGALEFITALITRHGGAVRVWEFEDRGVTEIGFLHPSDSEARQSCQAIVAEWCAANFPGTPIRSSVAGKHRRL